LDFIHPDDRGMVVERYQKRLRRERFIDVYPFRIIDKWGKTRWVEINVVFVNWAGRPATLNFLTDITSRRAMEEELLKVQKLESIGVLAGGIAHDFNNILTAILGNISLAKIYSEGGDRAGERLTEAEKACLQAQALTQQLLTFSKGGAPVKKVLSVSQLVSDSSLFALRGSNVRSEMSVPDDLWTVEADEGQIGQVIGNLVINADEAMPLGGVIHVQAENVTMTASDGLPIRDGKYVRVSVTDYGVGIPQEILPRIFDPYFTTKQKGSGLGLTTAYSIVKNHDGLITVESRPGVATTFHVYLPASEKEEEPRQDSEEQLIRGKGRILLMDDEETIRDLAAEMLSLMGYEVVLAEHGAEAIDLYKSARISSRPFDAIIMDLTVRGGMGGREAIEILSKIDPNIKAIVSSGYSSDPIMADYGKYGFSGVAAKPYTASELGEILSKVLKQRES
jgi:signal transduction histidine kinase/CheY-like chemotaxis protein